ncbi:MAG TPA: O-antigen ligase family protein [Candidatus Eisenbacteria bacterium]|nr:O-antigen ligase family protein [Candidatus Eisenbacteria bacterium]
MQDAENLSTLLGFHRPAPTKTTQVILTGLFLLLALLAFAISPWKALAVIMSAAVVVAVIARPEWMIMFLAAYTPLEPFLLKFVPDDLYIYARYFSEGLIYLLLASVLLRLLVRDKRLVATPLDLPFFFFLLVAVTSIIVNAVPAYYGILGLRQIVRFILLFFITVYLDPDTVFIKRVTSMMLGIVAFEGILGLLQSLIGGPLDEFLIPSERKFYESIQLTSGTEQFWSPGSRVFATLGRYDQLGTFLCFFFLLAIGLYYMHKKKEERRRFLVPVLIGVPALILTLSRASWFGFALAFFVIGAILMKDWKVRFAYVGAAVLALLYLAVTGITVRYLIDYPEQTVAERFFEAFSYERWRGEYYGLGRMYWIVQTPLVVVRSSPLFGVGPGQFGGGAVSALGNTTIYEKLNLPFGVYGTEGYIDNNWFSLWGETGTLGVAFYAWMLIALARMALNVWRESKDPYVRGLALGYAGCVVAVAFQAFLATYFEVRTLALYLWLYGAFLYVLARREKIYVPV